MSIIMLENHDINIKCVPCWAPDTFIVKNDICYNPELLHKVHSVSGFTLGRLPENDEYCGRIINEVYSVMDVHIDNAMPVDTDVSKMANTEIIYSVMDVPLDYGFTN